MRAGAFCCPGTPVLTRPEAGRPGRRRRQEVAPLGRHAALVHRFACSRTAAGRESRQAHFERQT